MQISWVPPLEKYPGDTHESKKGFTPKQQQAASDVRRHVACIF
jgi:hypothetical protein